MAQQDAERARFVVLKADQVRFPTTGYGSGWGLHGAAGCPTRAFVVPKTD